MKSTIYAVKKCCYIFVCYIYIADNKIINRNVQAEYPIGVSE